MKTGWSWIHSVGAALTVVAIAAVGYRATDAVAAWLAIMALMVGLLVIVGHGIVGRPAGTWIDDRNKMTLSRLQLIAWTILVLSGFLAIALHNMQTNVPNPLDVAIPPVLWLAMGVSTASLVASALILDSKKRQPPNTKELQRTVSLLARSPQRAPEPAFSAVEGTSPSDRFRADKDCPAVIVDTDNMNVRAVGRVEVRPTSAEASWADLFRGDETGDAAYVDMGKVQLLLLTVVVLLAYGLSLYTSLSGGARILGLPAIDEGLLALLGISHAGYLSTKAVNHSAPPTRDP